MCFDKILEVLKTIMPLLTVFLSGCVVPSLVDWWEFRKMRRYHRSLFSHLNKFCRSLGGTSRFTEREICFDNDSDIEALIQKDKDKPSPTEVQGWIDTHICHFRTALNAIRKKHDLESGKFYFSRHFLGKNYSELLVVLTVSGNTATLQTFTRGPWEMPQTKKKTKLCKTKLFGYGYPEYSIMLV